MVVFALQSNVSNNNFKSNKFDFVEIVDLSAIATKDEEKKPVENKPSTGTVLGSYKIKGDLTGYSADCPACNGTLSCKRSYNVYKNNVVTYPDTEYGNVRIVAAHQKNLKCGSIIKFNLSTISNEPIYAIVLDRDNKTILYRKNEKTKTLTKPVVIPSAIDTSKKKKILTKREPICLDRCPFSLFDDSHPQYAVNSFQFLHVIA